MVRGPTIVEVTAGWRVTNATAIWMRVNPASPASAPSASAASSETPGAALAAWLHRFFAFSAGKRHIASELLKQTDRSNPIFENNRTR
jgi:hypothetical protein